MYTDQCIVHDAVVQASDYRCDDLPSGCICSVRIEYIRCLIQTCQFAYEIRDCLHMLQLC